MTETNALSKLIQENEKLKAELQGLMAKQLENANTIFSIQSEADEKIKKAQTKIDQLQSNLQSTQANLDQVKSTLSEEGIRNRHLELKILELENKLRIAENRSSKKQKEITPIKEKLRDAEKELKELRALDPKGLKKNLVRQKEKVASQVKEISSLNRQVKILKSGSEEILETQRKLDNAMTSIDRMLCETDGFYVSDDERWVLRMTAFKFMDEDQEADDQVIRIRCLDRQTGTSVLAIEADDEGKALWSHPVGVPDDLSLQAAKEIESLKTNGRLTRNQNPIRQRSSNLLQA